MTREEALIALSAREIDLAAMASERDAAINERHALKRLLKTNLELDEAEINKLKRERDEAFQNYVDANEARLEAEAKLGEAINIFQRALNTHDFKEAREFINKYRQDALKEMANEAHILDLP